MSYEKEQAELQRLLGELEGDSPLHFDDTMSDGSLEGDNVEIQDENTDSEQEVEAMEMPLRVPSFVAKNGVTWEKHPGNKKVRTRAENIIKHLPGVKPAALHLYNPSQLWGCFFSDEVLQVIVENTNIYIGMKNYSSENRTARLTDFLEIKAFIGLLYIAGCKKNNALNAEELFRTNGTSLEIYRLTMSLARFQFLLAHLRFDDKRSRGERQKIDKLAAIRSLFTKVNESWPKYFSLSEFATVDEMLPGFRGKCSFRVYMPSKPNRYGIKIYALVDAKMFYCANLEVYIGKQHPGPYKLDTSNISLLPRICLPISGTNRNVTMDNFFTSLQVAELLRNEHRLTIIGTMRKNRPEIPTQFNIKRREKSTMFAFREKTTLVSYIPKPRKNVILLSTMHYDDEINKITGKPSVIMDYNATKSGVDILDKMCEAYNCARGTCRWPMVIFYTLLNIAGINSYIIHKNNRNAPKTPPRRLFLEQLGMELVDGHIRRRAVQENIPRTIRTRLMEICSIDIPHNAPVATHGRCYWCGSKKK